MFAARFLGSETTTFWDDFTVTLGASDRTLDSKDEEKYLSKVRDRCSEVGAELRGLIEKEQGEQDAEEKP